MPALSSCTSASGSLGRRYRYGVPLAPLTSLKIGGAAERLLAPTSRSELSAAVRTASGEGWPVWILGGGSNLLIPDEGVAGLVLDLSAFKELVIEGTSVYAGAGLHLSRLISAATGAGLAGLEGLAAIPGLVGGACAMNAGGKFGEIGDSVTSLTVLRADGALCRLSRAEVGFTYRGTGLQGAVILGATLALKPGDAATLRAEVQRISRAKRAGQPYDLPSAGCTFRNPPGGVSAGTLIDRAGLKGERRGGAEISTRHANFIVNRGGATAEDVMKLAGFARERVFETFGVRLEYEIKAWTPSSKSSTGEWSVPGPG